MERENVRIVVPDKPTRRKDERGYWRENGKLVHREVWEAAFGKLPRGWVVHHCDKNKENNALDNLVGLPEPYHDQIHLDETLPRRVELLAYYHFARESLEKLLPRWRESRWKLNAVENELRALGINPEKLARDAGGSKKKKRGRGPLKYWAPPKPKTLTTGDRKADQTRVKEIKALRGIEEETYKKLKSGDLTLSEARAIMKSGPL